MIKQKQIDKIDILIMNNWIQLRNTINGASIDYHSEKGSFSFVDPYGNRMQNHGASISINLDFYELREMGKSINLKDGTVIAYLSDADVRELASKGFYEEGQTIIFDFNKMEFLVEI
ncbi:MAG: hypothetical protein QM535_05675 [Limnohabitans sp.]|nr:hypothetical protein [Limnohabitans sp.]